MNTVMRYLTTFAMTAALLLILGATAPARARHYQSQQHDHAQQKEKKSDHHSEVDRRGDHVMGFSHAKTTHHFRLKTDGGMIEVEANDAQDSDSRERIRAHFRHIAQKFAAGDFTAPMLIHAQEPPGVPVMKRLAAEIRYDYEQTERGARLRLKTSNAEALSAIHEFLRFQIRDHRTGDSGEVEKN